MIHIFVPTTMATTTLYDVQFEGTYKFTVSSGQAYRRCEVRSPVEVDGCIIKGNLPEFGGPSNLFLYIPFSNTQFIRTPLAAGSIVADKQFCYVQFKYLGNYYSMLSTDTYLEGQGDTYGISVYGNPIRVK